MSTEKAKNELLSSVSRSFYLTIRALPAPLRAPIRTAYLLARVADTLADTAAVPVPARLRQLEAWRRMIATGQGREQAGEITLAMAPWQTLPAEQRLLAALPAVLADLAALEPDDQVDVRWVLEQITTGQAQDLATPRLANDAALERYTWLVAGCVGEFWTRLGLRKLTGYAILPEAEMRRLGAEYGQGLQLVNILRDYPEDVAQGRHYLPRVEDYGQWKERAATWLESGWQYVLALRSWRLRLACALPVLLGMRTLALLGTTPPLAKIKVTRKEVRSILWQTAWRAGSRRWLAAYWLKMKG